MSTTTTDTEDLAQFGYKQELGRTLGSFSSFAAGFSIISVLTGIYQLFGFGFGLAGPAVWWTWPIVLAGQFAVALCFAELAGQFPLAGSVYQWTKNITSKAMSWMAGWILICGSIINVAAVAVAWQVILPQISTKFEFIGTKADAGTYLTTDGAKNAIVLGLIMVVITTVVNMLGVRVIARLNNIGVAAELIGSTILVVLLLIHAHRGPGVITNTLGTGHAQSWGVFGALLIGGIMSAYVLYGFDVASTLAEETTDPRRKAPRAILRALMAAGISGGALILTAVMAVRDVHDKNISLLGLPYIVKQALGSTVGDVFLIDAALAILVCALALHTSCIRMLFAMARDGRLPFGPQIARVSEKRRVPVLPALIVGVLAVGILAINLGNKGAFVALTSVSIVMFYLAYLCCTVGMLIQRMRGTWPRANHGPYFSMGRWGWFVNIVGIAYGGLVTVDVAWPRLIVYNPIGAEHWYYKWAAFTITGFVIVVGAIYYFLRQHGQSAEVLEAHRVDIEIAEPVLGIVAP